MRVIQTVNDTIRLLYNPKSEIFSLSDFLLVRDSNEHFLGQVVEVYDDKFDLESNVAKIKLIYRIVNGNELLPYNNYTPSRECEVAKIKQSEIEKCINLNKKTVKIGKSFKSGDETEINLNFFNNNLVIYADKYEQTNRIFENLAGKLSEQKPVVVLDFSGSCNFDRETRFIAGENFKIPLSSMTIDFLRQKVLLRAKAETQVILGDIFDEVRDFLENSDEDYVPYARFIRVVQGQCKQTPSVELLVLISWLKKYARGNVFAKNKKEFDNFLKSAKKNKITTIDFSGIKTEWQKEYVEYIINALNERVYLFIRLNDNNMNYEILNQVYLKKKNISFIPSFAYGYSKASYIMDYAKNYILMPTINPRRDFTSANFQIQSLNKDSYMLFGEDTKDFIFVVENSSEIQKRKRENPETDGRLLISLNLELEDMTPLELMTDNFEKKPPENHNPKRLQEEIRLSDILKDKNEEIIEADNPPIKEESLNNEIKEPAIEAKPPISNEAPINNGANSNDTKETALNSEVPNQDEDIINKKTAPNVAVEVSYTENVQDKETINNDETADIVENIDNPNTVENIGNKEIEETKQEEYPIINTEYEENTDVYAKPQQNENIIEEQFEDEPREEKFIEQEYINENTSLSDIPQEEIVEDEAVSVEISETYENDIPASKNAQMPKIKEIEVQEEETEEQKPESPLEEFARLEENSNYEENEEETIDESVLDAIDEINQLNETELEEAKEAEEIQEYVEEEPLIEQETSETEEINRQFEKIMSEEQKGENKKDVLKINDKVSINLKDIKKDHSEKAPLPIFDDGEETTGGADGQVEFKEDDTVFCDKYGIGQVLKVIKYGDRCLLQIEFPEIGKRLLDTKIAKIQLAQGNENL